VFISDLIYQVVDPLFGYENVLYPIQIGPIKWFLLDISSKNEG
jgi:hypothetical protein